MFSKNFLKEDWLTDKHKREYLIGVSSEIIKMVNKKQSYGEIIEWPWANKQKYPAILYTPDPLTKHSTYLLILIVPKSASIDSAGGFSVKGNYIIVYLYVDDIIYNNFKKNNKGVSSDGWSNLISRSIKDDNKEYFDSALYHELEHWYDYHINKFNFNAYKYGMIDDKVTPQQLSAYHIQPLEYNAYYGNFIRDLESLIRELKEESGRESEFVKKMDSTPFNDFVNIVDAMTKGDNAPLFYHSEFWNTILHNAYWKKKTLKRLYGWYKNVFPQIIAERRNITYTPYEIKTQVHYYMSIKKQSYKSDATKYGYPDKFLLAIDKDFNDFDENRKNFIINNKLAELVPNKNYDPNGENFDEWWNVNYKNVWLYTKKGEEFADMDEEILPSYALLSESPIPSYHGGPNAFDKFDAYYINTGEQAQAFGWGLYFTSNPKIAEDYAIKLGSFRKFKMTLNGVDILDNPNWVNTISNYYISHYGQPDLDEQDIYAATHVYMNYFIEFIYRASTKTVNQALKDTDDIISNSFELAESIEGDYHSAREYVRGLENIIRNKEIKIFRQKPNIRNVYHVTLWPDKEPNLLSWTEKPTEQQFVTIFNEWKKSGLQYPLKTVEEWEKDGVPLKDYNDGMNDNDWVINIPHGYNSMQPSLPSGLLVFNNGENLYKIIESALNSPMEASHLLLRAGIDGIVYPSGIVSGYRGEMGQNFVVFDDNQIRIERNKQF